MSKSRTILRRTIVARPVDALGGDLLAVQPLPEARGTARLYFRAALAPDLLPDAGQKGVTWSRTIAGAPTLDVQTDGKDTVHLSVGDSAFAFAVDPDESALLAGRRVIMGKTSGETPETLRDWLLWHRRHHQADGALIVERAAPEEAATRADDLDRLLASDPAIAAELAGMAIIVVNCDRPLGDASLGPEGHPMNAPDAPGKDRMEAPAPDGWSAPLAYRLLFDLLRRRFLGAARAVANIEVIDLIPPGEEGATIFDMADRAPKGLLPLSGTRCYPWGLRNSAEPAFSDHVCTRFDVAGSENRWCVAPDKLPGISIWLPTRVLGAKAMRAPHPFWRFMALRYGRGGNQKLGQIVPKTSLVENADLLALSASLGGDAMRPPTDLPAEAVAFNAGDGPRNRVAIVTTMKNEGPFILEWLAYHRAIGVQDFLIYTNDCTDGTDSFLQLLDRKGICQWRENPYRQTGAKPQHAALDAANAEPLITGADWVICMDVDEYIAIHTGDGTLKALFGQVPEANMISLTWRLFGNNDIDGFQDGFITQSFTRCARAFANKPHQAWGFKTLYRNIGLFNKLGVHRPKGLQPTAVARINWVNGSGEAMPRDQWRNAWRSHAGTYGYDLVSLNHYAVRSAESFLVKRDRGRVNHVDRDQGMAYWFRMNHNVVEDDRMRAILPLLQAEYESLLSDPEIRAAHDGCVAAHIAKIDELKQQPKYEAFHQELTSERMQRLSRLHGHFGANVYLAGPEVIPDEVAMRDPADDFFFTVAHEGDTRH